MKIRAVTALLFLSMSVNGLAQEGRIKLSGNVRDADGNPLDLVAVQVKNTWIGAMTNEEGFYALSVAPGDSVTLLFSCLGYNRAERIIPHVTQNMRVNVQMNYTSVELGEVSVTAIQRQTTTMETIDANRLKILPDPSGGNIESLVVTHAGVSSSNELSSQYSVRGGNYDENIVYVNGMEVFRPLLIRSGEQEGLSFINPNMTEAVQFSAGGFEARYGDKMSSALDIKYKKPKAFEGSASVGLMGASVYAGSSAGKFTQVTGFRYKTGRALLNTMDTEADYDPSFMDFQTYWTYELSPRWEANFLGNLSLNNYKFTPHERKTSFGTANHPRTFYVGFDGMERDRFQTLYGAFTLKRRLGGQSEIGFQAFGFNSREEESYDIAGLYRMDIAASNDSEDALEAFSLAGYHEHARNRLLANVAHAGLYGITRVHDNHTLKWGAGAQREQISDKISEWESRDSSGYSLPQTGTDVQVIANLFSDNEIESTRFSAYVQDVFKFRTEQGLFTIVGGVRGSYWTYNREFLFSPRISAGFIPNANQNWTFRLASGVYYQSAFYKELRVETKDGNDNSVIRLNDRLKSQRSIHLIGGGDYAFRAAGRNFKLTTEMYYKKLDDINPYTVDNVKVRYYGENCAKGYIAGMDMKIFGEMVPGTDSWLSLSLMKAEQTIRGVTKAPLPNSQGYNLSLYFQDYFPGYKRAMLNLKGVLAGGFPVTALRKGYEDGYYRTPPYRRVDIGMTYQFASGVDAIMDRRFFKPFKNIWLGVDVFNLLDIRNTVSYYWITDVYNQQYAVPNYLTGRQLNVRLSIDF
ncbi:MAG: carboxypeptidase-like regulatory domain-containing protein [Tannerella sp.]|nr:carboxypeptidase-like regulatory domain-containing protein [Tannerella sp.]